MGFLDSIRIHKVSARRVWLLRLVSAKTKPRSAPQGRTHCRAYRVELKRTFADELPGAVSFGMIVKGWESPVKNSRTGGPESSDSCIGSAVLRATSSCRYSLDWGDGLRSIHRSAMVLAARRRRNSQPGTAAGDGCATTVRFRGAMRATSPGASLPDPPHWAKGRPGQPQWCRLFGGVVSKLVSRLLDSLCSSDVFHRIDPSYLWLWHQHGIGCTCVPRTADWK